MARIAFVGNIASISYLLARELISRGHQVDVYAGENLFQTNKIQNKSLAKKYGLPFERTLSRFIVKLEANKYRTLRRFIVKLEANKYDLELRSFENRLVQAKYSIPIYHGSDIRGGTRKIEYPCFYTTKDLEKYLDPAKRAIWLPRCADTTIFRKRPRNTIKDEIIIGHFPSDPEIKGTRYVLEAIQILNQRGIKASLHMKKTSHESLPQMIASCHVVCDWFNPKFGLYGVLSIESLLLDRPVICYVKDENFDYPEMKNQIINCNPSAEDIADGIIKNVNKQIDVNLVSSLYSPERSTNVLVNGLVDLEIM
jgi:glycosyltransferase involved in cell wall biosynthesis